MNTSINWNCDEDIISDDFNDIYLDETQIKYERKYDNRTPEEKQRRLEESHEEPKIWEKLGKYAVDPHQRISIQTMKELIRLIENSEDEREIQQFLEKNPYLITRGIHPAHHMKVCYPKPRLGAEYVPDFLIAGIASDGFSWYGVELESPKYAMFTKTGEETSELKHAIRQIEDWRNWLTDNISYARGELGFAQIDVDLPCFIFIGRRENETLSEELLRKRRKAVKNRDKYGLYLHHYEWLIDVPSTFEFYKRDTF